MRYVVFQLRPFKIISVKNTETGSSLSEGDAIKQGVLDDNRITYTDNTTGKQVLIADAIQVNFNDQYFVVIRLQVCDWSVSLSVMCSVPLYNTQSRSF